MNILKKLFIIQEVRVVVTQDHDHDDKSCKAVCPDCGSPCMGEEGDHFGQHLCSSKTCGMYFESPW